jgi:hypothetical protein
MESEAGIGVDIVKLLQSALLVCLHCASIDLYALPRRTSIGER